MKHLLTDILNLLSQPALKEEGITSRQAIIRQLTDFALPTIPLDDYGISYASFEDIEAIMALQELAYEGFIAWYQKDFERDFQRNPYGVYIIVRHQDQLIAMISGRCRAKGSHISHLLVHPNYQGQGLGSLLLNTWLALNGYLRIPKVTLEVRQSNLKAQALYRAHQFIKIKTKYHYYDDNLENAYEMIHYIREGHDYLAS
ncbi:ribosomal protein S18-alanine N-acetyltransferase [Hutsoniella sourekii]|uniref:ribosomal protein S18-alanine N-acetyltransferase n=1 Tax=Hutsoniella sourekii TaxID=87650 RepID=UPI0004B8366C|nr:ribosomal protein S18-alanine N-acetyltransferase [Hutsoniella sourekii]